MARRSRRRRSGRKGDRSHRPHLNSWDCLGALAVAQAAGARTNDYLTVDALLHGNRIVVGPPAVYDALDTILGGR